MSLNESLLMSSSDGENAPRVYNLGGVTIKFPADIKPYKSQLSLMSKAVTGARKAQNCLLESPTGSGKTMAMLCSLLAWQKTVKDEAAKTFQAEIQDSNALFHETSAAFETDIQVLPAPVTDTVVSTTDTTTQNRMQFIETWASESPTSVLATSDMDLDPAQASFTRSRSPDIFCDDDDDDDLEDFKPPKKKCLIQPASADDTIIVSSPGTSAPSNTPDMSSKDNTNCNSASGEKAKPPSRTRVPKIFFATRTHKQIAQVVRELKRTPYRDVRMTILGSKEHTCIRKLEMPHTNKNDMCKALLEQDHVGRPGQQNKGSMKRGCMFKKNLDRLPPSLWIDSLSLETPWDIEELVAAGKSKKLCPHFVSRNALSGAEIVFCPYNYLVDPFIRKSVSVSLKNNVIVFDEAHNIEDSMRAAISYVLEENSLEKAIQECKLAMGAGSSSKNFTTLANTFQILLDWMKELSSKLNQEVMFSNDRSVTLTGTHYLAHMENKGIGPAFLDKFTQAVHDIFEDPRSVSSEQEEEEEDEKGDNKEEEVEEVKVVIHQLHKPSQNLSRTAEYLALVWGYLFQHDMKYTDDYNVVLSETSSRIFAEDVSNDSAEGGWTRRPRVAVKVQLSLNFWCMNPAVAFTAFHDAHSVLVTSGTLSPMASFQSELGMSFPQTLSTDHVIDPSQAWVASVGVGPAGKILNGTYKNAITMDYQDEVGSSILKICQAVPYGVLCFFPSYVMLENVVKRWQQTNKWNQLLACKQVLKEPRRGTDFDDVLYQYDFAIKRAEAISARGNSFPYGEQTGALFLAVFRGKLSEGIDFKDNHARAVITVSIPFPSMSDLQVKLKKKYNDSHSLKDKRMLPGNQWYEIQAFRAINQALGRCVRHRNDWGAIILLDNRFSQDSRATASLSKWAVKEIQHFSLWESMYSRLQHFMKTRTQLTMPDDDDDDETEIIEAY